jgi:CheY-like chemotaxis protein
MQILQRLGQGEGDVPQEDRLMVKSRPPRLTRPAGRSELLSPSDLGGGGRWVSFARACERLRGLTAVVLDRDVESSGRIFISLGHVGTQVRLARAFTAGLQLLDQVKPDLLLAATRLDDGDVLQLFTSLKTGPARCPRLVALGGPSGRLEQRRFVSAGCDVFMRKPIDVRLFALELARQLPDPDR